MDHLVPGTLTVHTPHIVQHFSSSPFAGHSERYPESETPANIPADCDDDRHAI
jgi:hypothetical protein